MAHEISFIARERKANLYNNKNKRKEKNICQSISSSNDRLILIYVDEDELESDEDLFVGFRSINVVKRVESLVDVEIVVMAVNCGEGDEINNVSCSASSFNDEENDGVRLLLVFEFND